jgi:hypothetical protein
MILTMTLLTKANQYYPRDSLLCLKHPISSFIHCLGKRYPLLRDRYNTQIISPSGVECSTTLEHLKISHDVPRYPPTSRQQIDGGFWPMKHSEIWEHWRRSASCISPWVLLSQCRTIGGWALMCVKFHATKVRGLLSSSLSRQQEIWWYPVSTNMQSKNVSLWAACLLLYKEAFMGYVLSF